MMGYSKRQYITAAFNEIGLASYVFDIQPQGLENAMRQLDAMIEGWNGRGIRLGYPVPTDPEDSDLDDATNIPDYANEAVIKNLAIRLASSFGKPVSRELKVDAKNALQTCMIRNAKITKMQMPTTMPRGAGQKPWRNDAGPFVDAVDNGIEIGPDGFLETE